MSRRPEWFDPLTPDALDAMTDAELDEAHGLFIEHHAEGLRDLPPAAHRRVLALLSAAAVRAVQSVDTVTARAAGARG